MDIKLFIKISIFLVVIAGFLTTEAGLSVGKNIDKSNGGTWNWDFSVDVEINGISEYRPISNAIIGNAYLCTYWYANQEVYLRGALRSVNSDFGGQGFFILDLNEYSQENNTLNGEAFIAFYSLNDNPPY